MKKWFPVHTSFIHPSIHPYIHSSCMGELVGAGSHFWPKYGAENLLLWET
jgi:hypothetical protein